MVRNWQDNPLKIIALCKTFSGEEFVEAMIESIYNFVDKIIFVNSDISWTGEKGNTVKEIISNWKRNSDINNKIVQINYNTQNQVSQYNIGIDYVRKNFDYDFLMLVDTDEIWDEFDLIKCKNYLEQTYFNNINAYTVNMRTYIKSPFYRLKNIEPCKPTIFVKNTINKIKGVRGNKITPRTLIPNVFMHHFTYVRSTTQKVLNKIKSSTKEDYLQTVDLTDWVINKWDKLPNPDVTNLHTSKGYEHYWEGVEIVTKEQLPKIFSLRNFAIIQNNTPIDIGLKETINLFSHYKNSIDYKNLPQGELVIEDEKILFDVSSQCRNILDIGTFLGRSALILANPIFNRQVDTLDVFEYVEYISDNPNKTHYKELFQKIPHTFDDVKERLSKYNINVILRDKNYYSKLKSKYDAIFFDGDHSYEGVKTDFLELLPFLNNNHLLIFHDSFLNKNAPHHKVYLFIDKFISPYYNKILEGGSTTVWRKKC